MAWEQRAGSSAAACLLLGACWFDGDLKHDTGTTPEALDDGWVIDTPENVGLSSAVLADIHHRLLSEDHYRGALSFLVVKDGKLVFETYLRLERDRDHYNHIQSATKSVTSLALGIAWQRGLVPTLELSVAELFPEQSAHLEPSKRGITLQHLLTMRSGLAFYNDDFSVEMWIDKPSDPIQHMLDKPLYAPPGTEFRYRDVDPQLAGYALSELSGHSERELIESSVFAALGIRNFYWEAAPDGISMAAHGLHLLPRDLAKLGLLVLDRGAWHGQQIVSADWLTMATSTQVESDVAYAGSLLGYGYYFWVVPGVGPAMWGHGGQFVVIVPERDLVLVQTAYPDTDLPESDLPDFLALVAPLLADSPLTDSPLGAAR